jgi:hypothetical protein
MSNQAPGHSQGSLPRLGLVHNQGARDDLTTLATQAQAAQHIWNFLSTSVDLKSSNSLAVAYTCLFAGACLCVQFWQQACMQHWQTGLYAALAPSSK